MIKMLFIPILISLIFTPLIVSADDPPPLIDSQEDITNIITNVTKWFYQIVLAIAIIMILYGAFTYITAGDSEDKSGKAKKILIYAVIGIVVALMAYGMQAFIENFFSTAAQI